ncbi:HNH endonuclease [Aeribacillus composti]|uniref:HNH endonuclease n=1 Tax=Aeribacillus composti TaxID=1868734 RepID=UPI002E1A62BE|nr:HNH endonuclease [Aeribacillus composti]
MELLTLAGATIEKMIETSSIEGLKEASIESALETIENASATPEALNAFENMDIAVDEGIRQEIIRIETLNDHLEGTVHPETGVPFEVKVIELPDGTIIEGVFPQFDSVFDVQLPENMYLDTDYQQFSYANEQLKEAIQQNPELAKQFNDLQLEQIKAGETPDGFTWHHSEEVGKLQLVDERIHALTGHTGGRTIWGGGSLYR